MKLELGVGLSNRILKLRDCILSLLDSLLEPCRKHSSK